MVPVAVTCGPLNSVWVTVSVTVPATFGTGPSVPLDVVFQFTGLGVSVPVPVNVPDSTAEMVHGPVGIAGWFCSVALGGLPAVTVQFNVYVS